MQNVVKRVVGKSLVRAVVRNKHPHFSVCWYLKRTKIQSLPEDNLDVLFRYVEILNGNLEGKGR